MCKLNVKVSDVKDQVARKLYSNVLAKTIYISLYLKLLKLSIASLSIWGDKV